LLPTASLMHFLVKVSFASSESFWSMACPSHKEPGPGSPQDSIRAFVPTLRRYGGSAQSRCHRLARAARNLACRTPAPRSLDPLSDHREKSAPTMRGRWQRARRRRTPPPPPRDCRDCFRSTPFEPLAPNPSAGFGSAVGIRLAGHCCGTILSGAFPLANAFTRLLATSVSAPGCNGVTNSSSGRRAALTAISAAS
jgi:hypothetical protein